LFHEPEKISEPDAATQYRFEQGHLVSELAKKLFPDGVDVPTDDFIGNIKQTRELLGQRKTVFEAGISAGNIYARVDILSPVDDNEWDIIEVKSSTNVKDVDIHDVSFQRFCCQQFGLEIRKCFLMHINNEYIRQGEIDPEQLFITKDITEKVENVISDVQDKVDTMFEVISATQCPDVTISRQCNHPYDCPITECWDFLPDYSVFELYRGGQKCFELLNNGILSIKDIPGSFNLTGKQKIQRACVLCGQPHTDSIEIRRFLSALQYPLYYLDFETLNTAIPLFDGTRPYQNIPFQFSLHDAIDEESEPRHFSFLAEGKEDPRPKLLSELKKLIGNRGSIIVYNQSFEKAVLKDLGEAFPKYSEWVQDTLGMFVDLLNPFKNFWYYHPAQKGSASLKTVLPVLTGKGYEGLNIANGEDASLAFRRVTYGDVSEEERDRVRKDLEEYCGQDTEGMMRIVNALENIIK